MDRYMVLLRDYGYRFDGKTLIERGIKGYTSDRVVGRFRDAQAAAEYLCPIIKDDEFTSRLSA